jgi:hypothetical protein
MFFLSGVAKSMSVTSVTNVFKRPSARVFTYAALWGLFLVLHPAVSNAAAFDGLTRNINDFKTALTSVSAALVVIGLVSSAIGWMMRSHEGLGPVFWGGITMVGAGSLVLLGDNFVSSIR